MPLTPLQAWFQRVFVSERVHASDYVSARHARLQATFILAFLSIPSALLLLGPLLGGVSGSLMVAMLLEIGVLIGALFVLRLSGRLAISGNMFVGTYFAVTLLTVSTTGGLMTTNAAWLLLAPLMALLLVGWRSGLAWLVTTTVTIAALGAAHRQGLMPEAPPVDEVVLTTANVIGCMLVAFACAALYEKSMREMLAEVHHAHGQASRALAGTRLVLDNIDEGLLVVRRDGTLEVGRSLAVQNWFGASSEVAPSIWALVKDFDASAAAWLELGWNDLFDGALPQEVVLSQLPAKLSDGERVLGVSYLPMSDGDQGVLVMMRDVTEAFRAQKTEQKERQLVELLSRVSRDRSSFLAMWGELRGIVGRIATESEMDDATHAVQARDLHTLKGNAGLLNLHALAELCHDAETRGLNEGVPITNEDRLRIASAFAELDDRLQAVIATDGDAVIIHRVEYDAMVRRALEEPISEGLARSLTSWAHDPVAPHLELAAQSGVELAARLGKGKISVLVQHHDTRVPHGTYAPFFSALIHAVRNAVDHGLETPTERERLHKPATGTLRLSAVADARALVIEVQDDGRGIDWSRLEVRAKSLGLSHATREALIEALFSDGVSSRDEASETSGRGLGLAALRASVRALGGTVEVESTPLVGCTFRFRFPVAQASHALPPPPLLLQTPRDRSRTSRHN